jgi:ABC-type polysaccharide/polyol phosphate transport system ATPase subunit
MTKTFRVTSEAQSEPWEGSVEELLEDNAELGTFVTKKIERMSVGETVRLRYETEFTVERLR